MSAAMIEQTAARLFADHVNRALLQECEGGHWPARLWGLVADNGLDLALAGEAAGGIGASRLSSARPSSAPPRSPMNLGT